MFPQFHLPHIEKKLKPTEYQTLKSLVYLLHRAMRHVSIELLF